MSQYNKCPMAYKLARVDRHWKRKAAWLYQGTALHAADEFWDRSGRTAPPEAVHAEFDRVYAEETNRALSEVPNTDYWFKSGPYAGAIDIERRHGIGHEQVDKLLAWYEKHPEEQTWIAPDGTPAIELRLEVMLGSVPVVAILDDVIQNTETGEIWPRDTKSGNRPGDVGQLMTQAAVLQVTYPDVEFSGKADFWMGKTGKPTIPKRFDDSLVDEVTAMFEELDAKILAEEFPARPEPDKCNMCDVSLNCPVWN
jgi:putative RecB family exonuclease